MTKATNRPRRKDRTRAAALLLAVAMLALAAAPAQAAPGGASTLASAKARTGAGLAFSPMRWAGATWYGPGLYGNSTACGQTLRPRTMGVAHRSLPCGTTVKLVYGGRRIVTQVIDRGPYSRGNDWDLTYAAARALRFHRAGVGQIGYAVSIQFAKARAARRAARRARR